MYGTDCMVDPEDYLHWSTKKGTPGQGKCMSIYNMDIQGYTGNCII